MARKRKSGGRRKGIKVTPLRIAKALVVVDALRRSGPAFNEIKFVVQNPSSVMTGPGAAVHAKQLAQALVAPLAEGLIGPKLLEKGVQLLSKGEPALGRVARVKLITV